MGQSKNEQIAVQDWEEFKKEISKKKK